MMTRKDRFVIDYNLTDACMSQRLNQKEREE